MCDFTQGFKLCTCTDDAATESGLVKFRWYLSKYRGATDGMERGRYVPPVIHIGTGLSATTVCAALNASHCFDFDYEPAEGDNLILKAELTDAGAAIFRMQLEDRKEMRPLRNPVSLETGRLEFIFQQGKWEIAHYNPFEDETELTSQGKIEPKVD